MPPIEQALDAGGFWMWGMLVAFAASLVWTLVQFAITGWWRRLPSFVWWLGPVTMFTLGGCGLDSTFSEVVATLPEAEPAHRVGFIAQGASLSLNYLAFTGLGAAILGLAVANGVGFGSFVRSADRDGLKWTKPLVAFGAALLAAVGLGFWAVSAKLGGAAFFIPLTLVVSTAGAAASALRHGGEGTKGKRTADRFAAAVGLVVSVAGAAIMATTVAVIEAFSALEGVSPENRETLMDKGVEIAFQIGDVGLVGVGVAVLIGAFLVLAESDGLTAGRFPLESAAVVVVFLPPAVSGWMAKSDADQFLEMYREQLESPAAERAGETEDADGPDGGDRYAVVTRPDAETADTDLDAGSPGCDDAAVQQVVEERVEQVRYCYERRLQEVPELAGKVVLEWRINPEGAVETPAVVETSLDDEEAESCLVDTVGQFTFPEPEGGSCVVEYPFTFRASTD